ncbi:HAD family hydrolase [Verminephrobacter aporrectodeae]|uniref:HAD family hydrolase n=1 Tax=Verminephrobacter aporrectodeae TaxID=1110389 RepID=UPI002242FCE5|nr:HAD-IB family hydrolase [Verminephrobacter aporrectodeae]MCW8175653.1 HAD-IB family hydrolase [Verminephrobacter aporrectodeae subsp. tuberculatae]MCW8203238.1 HAD-IB family hydrolase [Verminephrobacter aporrectodeae subsp. tuberculatae]
MKVRSIAFFDVDETLINVKSMFSFRSFYFRQLWGEVDGAKADTAATARIEDHVRQGSDRSAINTLFYKDFCFHQTEQVTKAAQAWYEQERRRPGFFIQPVLDLLESHQREGDIVAFVSGSAVEFLVPLAKELGVTHVLANQLDIRDGLFTGSLIPPQTIGIGKQKAAHQLIAKFDVDASNCFGYGDHLSDLPLLESVGYPTVVARDPALVQYAEQRGWPVLHPGTTND